MTKKGKNNQIDQLGREVQVVSYDMLLSEAKELNTENDT